jgi:sulfotransferase famil protein
MWSLLSRSGIPGVTPPELLIFFHIPKTGGTTMEGVFDHNFPGKVFHVHGGPTASALLVRTADEVAAIFRQLSPQRQRDVRFVVGNHVAMDVDRLFERPSKFFTIVRDPVDRAISSFFYLRFEANQPETEAWLPIYRFIKNMTLDQYLDSGIGLDVHNQQVRMLSGCHDLDVPWNTDGRPIVAPPVERRHLDMAKRNIEERFLIAAPLKQFAAVVWYLKRLYAMPLRSCFYAKRRENMTRPALEEVSTSARRRLAEWNRYDLELYDWVEARFANQLAPMQPEFDRQVRQFAAANALALLVDSTMPRGVRDILRRAIFPQYPERSVKVATPNS